MTRRRTGGVSNGDLDRPDLRAAMKNTAKKAASLFPLLFSLLCALVPPFFHSLPLLITPLFYPPMRSPLLSSAATALFFLAQSQSIDAATLTPRFPIQEGSTSINVPLTKRTVVKDLASFTRKAEHMKAKYAPKAVKDKRLREKRASSNSISMTNYEDVYVDLFLATRL